jgi:hypothetical protein
MNKQIFTVILEHSRTNETTVIHVLARDLDTAKLIASNFMAESNVSSWNVSYGYPGIMVVTVEKERDFTLYVHTDNGDVILQANKVNLY